MVQRGGYVLLAAVLLLPLAEAAPAAGEFIVEGRTSLPVGATLDLAPGILFLDRASGLEDVVLRAPHARVHLFEERFVRTPSVGSIGWDHKTDGGSETFSIQDVEIRFLAGAQDGYLGIYPAPGAHARLAASAPMSVEARHVSEFASRRSTSPEEDPFSTWYYYRQVEDAPHLLAMAPGNVSYAGKGTMKLFGVDVDLVHAEGRHAVRTGVEEGRGAFEATYRWAIVEFDEAELDASSRAPWVLTGTAVDADWAGISYFLPVSGSLASGDAAFVPSGGAARVSGEFQGTFTPAPGGDEDAFARLWLEGSLSGTTLQSAAALPPAPRAGPSFLPLALAAAVGVGLGAAGTGWVFHRRRAPPAPAPPAAAPAPFTAEDCLDAGAKAASEEDWATAAKWFRRAHALAPTSARICADLGFSLSQIGDVEEALGFFAKASAHSADGEADFNAALVALQADRPVEEVEAWLERALQRSPALVLPLDSDNDFEALVGRPRYEAAVRRARARVGARRAAGEDLA